jgi:hypothetical protein
MRKVAIGCLLLAAASLASATPTYVATATGTASGSNLPIDAEADFTFSANHLTLTLINLLTNPTSVAQNITDFEFTIGTLTGTLSTTTLPSAGSTVIVNSDGSFAITNTPVNPGWAFSSSGGVFSLNGLAGTQNPAYSIIGAPGGATYSAADGSIANTGGPHNPFIYQSATWVFDISGVTATTKPTNIVFSFNTDVGDNFVCDASNGFCATTPEPSAWLLLATGLAGLAFFAQRAARKKTA